MHKTYFLKKPNHWVIIMNRRSKNVKFEECLFFRSKHNIDRCAGAQWAFGIIEHDLKKFVLIPVAKRMVTTLNAQFRLIVFLIQKIPVILGQHIIA